ncbi:MAG TPA: serine/threonine-protein kinase, partial [Chthoniobacteraceae bacterium]|nr:serine/threonine-protein kinase [Chthoniobacteraceae bacterium]
MTNSHTNSAGFESAKHLAQGQKVLGRYTLHRILGQGGMGVVWLASDDELNREVALKFLPSVVINDRASLIDLKRETKRSLELTHPHIVRTYDFVQDETIAGISMEYVDSDTLRHRRVDQAGGIFEPADLGDWTRQLCDALDYAHHHASIVHRDLKPANLMVNSKNHLKVADFGISRSLVESVTQVSGLSGGQGTLVYMSPQQLAGDQPHPTDDVYAVGATLFDLCTTRPPFYTGDISAQVRGKVAPSMAQGRAALGIAGAELPENWETTVAACLSKDPLQRPQCAGEIAVRLGLKPAADITGFQTSFAPPAPAPAPGPVRIEPPVAGVAVGGGFHPSVVPKVERARKSPALFIGAMAAVFVAAAIVLVLVGRRTPSDDKPKIANGPVPTPTKVEPVKPQPPDPGKPENIVPKPTVAQVFSTVIETEPTEATVKLDDRPAKQSPMVADKLTVGTHILKVSKPGFDDKEEKFEVVEGQPLAQPIVHLVQSGGWLGAVETNDPKAKITVKNEKGELVKNEKGEPAGESFGTWKSPKLPEGDYSIIVSKGDWTMEPKQFTVVKETAAKPVYIDVTRQGTVAFSNPSPGVKVKLDN